MAMPEIKAKPAFHEKQVFIVNHAYRCPPRFFIFILKCFKASVEACRASLWNSGIKDIYIGQEIMCLAKKLRGLFRRFQCLPQCLAGNEYAERREAARYFEPPFKTRFSQFPSQPGCNQEYASGLQQGLNDEVAP